jgi:hypothetical protein
MEDAGTSVDGRNEEQEGLDVNVPSTSVGLERLITPTTRSHLDSAQNLFIGVCFNASV